MRRWIALAAELYPRDWRERYGEEFDALLEDAPADSQQFLDVIRGALKMQLTKGIAYLKIAAALTAAGAIVAMSASYRVPPRYVASAVVQLKPLTAPAQATAKDAVARELDDRVAQFQRQAIERNAILRLVTDRKFDLYRQDRALLPLEDVLDRIKADGDIQIRPVALPGREGDTGLFRVSFAYPDKAKAQAVVGQLVTDLNRDNESLNAMRAQSWSRYWSEPFPFRDALEVVEPPTLPSGLSEPRRAVFLEWGAAAGLLLGLAAILWRRHPRSAAWVAACGLAGCAIGYGVSSRLPERYTATAVMRLTAPFDPMHLSGAIAPMSLRDWVERLRPEILNPDRLREMIYRNFGGDAAMRTALGPVRVEDFDLRLRDSPGAPASLVEFTFTGRDKEGAMRAVSQQVVRFQNQYNHDKAAMSGKDAALRTALQRTEGEHLEIVQPPKVDDDLTTHYRLEAMLGGALLGILLGIVWRGLRGRPHRTSTGYLPPFSLLPPAISAE